MKLEKTKSEWNNLGKKDPFWAVLTEDSKLDGKWNLKDFFATGDKEINEVMRNAKKFRIKINCNRVLDFGCGVGRLSQALSKKFKEVYGVDIAKSMIKKAKELNRYPKKCAYTLNERDDLFIFKDNTFDFVYTSIVLQHIEPRYTLKYLNEFSRILKPGGILVFQLPDRRKSMIKEIYTKFTPKPILNILRRLTRPHGLIIEMHPIKKEKVIKFLLSNNFKIIKILPDQSSGRGYKAYKYFCTKNKFSQAQITKT